MTKYNSFHHVCVPHSIIQYHDSCVIRLIEYDAVDTIILYWHSADITGPTNKNEATADTQNYLTVITRASGINEKTLSHWGATLGSRLAHGCKAQRAH